MELWSRDIIDKLYPLDSFASNHDLIRYFKHDYRP